MPQPDSAAAPAAPRTRITALNWGLYLMIVLIGFMGFYILYPLALILINSFNVATIGEPTRWGFGAWIRGVHRVRRGRGAVEHHPPDRGAPGHRLPARRPPGMDPGPHQHPLRPRIRVSLLDLLHAAQRGLHLRLDAAAGSGLRPGQHLVRQPARGDALRHLFLLGHRVGPHRRRPRHQGDAADPGLPQDGRRHGGGKPLVRRRHAAHHVPGDAPGDDADPGGGAAPEPGAAVRVVRNRAPAGDPLGLLRLLHHDRGPGPAGPAPHQPGRGPGKHHPGVPGGVYPVAAKAHRRAPVHHHHQPLQGQAHRHGSLEVRGGRGHGR